MTLILPRPRNLITHGIADTFRTACRCKSEIILRLSFINPRAFLIIRNMRELMDFTRSGNHILIKLYVIGMGIAPVHVCLAVIINPYGRVYVVPMLFLPDKRLANGVMKGAIGRIGHKHSNAVAMDRTIHIEFAVTFNDLLSPSSIVTIVPFKVLQRSHRAMILPVHHIGRGVE